MSELYEKMKAKGIDMGWYEKNKHIRSSTVIPLDDEECSTLSLYIVQLDGSLWSIKGNGEPYQKVREGIKRQEKSVYVCAHCKKQWGYVVGESGLIVHP